LEAGLDPELKRSTPDWEGEGGGLGDQFFLAVERRLDDVMDAGGDISGEEFGVGGGGGGWRCSKTRRCSYERKMNQ
jgi:hypothetical protein